MKENQFFSLQEDIKKLNEQQRAIITGFKKSSIIVAGPGTGKTRTVSILIADFLKKGFRLREILALTFSNKAAEELRSRVLDYYPHSFDECWISTFHSFCARILREQYHLVDINPDFKLLTSFKEALLMSEICKKQHSDAFAEFGKVLNKRGFQLEILSFIGLLKSNLVTPEQLKDAIKIFKDSKKTTNRLNEIHNLYKLYEQELDKIGYLDFRDLISLTIKVLNEKTAADHYKNKFKAILVDEFQDTDPAQFMLLSLLKGKGDKIKTAVIGDPKQSIYKFRGADPSMMAESGHFNRKFKADLFPLQINYRSTKNIVKLSSKLNWKEKDLFSSELNAHNQKDGFIEYYHLRDELDESKFICKKIASILIYGKEKKYKPSDIAILVRNNYQVDLIAEHLQTMNIDYEIAGDMKFFKSEEVILLASLLKTTLKESNEVEMSLKRAFASPLFGIDPIWVQAVLSSYLNTSMIDILKMILNQEFDELISADEITKIKAGFFAETMQMLLNTENEPLNVIFARIILAFKKNFADPSTTEARNMFHFRNMIADYCELYEEINGVHPTVSNLMQNFDEWLTYYASTLEERTDTQNHGVKIMTLHQSKGLQFPIVFICGLSEGTFPVNHRENLLLSTQTIEALKNWFIAQKHEPEFFNPYPLTPSDHLEEERRLFFVGITRAQEGLVLTSTQISGTETTNPAPFLKELKLTPQSLEQDKMPLNFTDFRLAYTQLTEANKLELDKTIDELELKIPKSISIHGIKIREFLTQVPDKIKLSDNVTFSASSIKNYLDCPRKFFFLNILRIRNPLENFQAHFIVGNAYHKCLEILHHPESAWNKGKYPTDEELEEIFEQNAFPLLTKLNFFEQHLQKQEILNALTNYRNAIFNTQQLPPHNTAEVENTFYFNLGKHKIVGRIDRLIAKEKHAIVVDYKTSKPLDSKKLFDNSFPAETKGFNPSEVQLPLYILAAQNMGFSNISAGQLFIKSDLYKRKYKDMQPGYIRAAFLNYGDSIIDFGEEVPQKTLEHFTTKLDEILSKIKADQTFDCTPSNEDNARSCATFDHNKNPNCDFLPFCQERLEELKKLNKGQ